MALECVFCEESVPADYLFTHLDSGDTVSMCAPHLPEFLSTTLQAVLASLDESTATAAEEKAPADTTGSTETASPPDATAAAPTDAPAETTSPPPPVTEATPAPSTDTTGATGADQPANP